MKHSHLSENMYVFFHSGDSVNFSSLIPNKCEVRFPNPTQNSIVIQLCLERNVPGMAENPVWPHKQCFGQSNISYGIGSFRT